MAIFRIIPSARVLTALPSALALSLLTSHVQASECLGEPLPRADLLCAAYLPQPVLPDTGTDSAARLQAGIEFAAAQAKGIFLPAGRYQLEGNLALRSNVSLIGSTRGATILGAPHAIAARAVGDMDYYTWVNDVTIENLIFDNVRIALHGRKMRHAIRYNAFINTHSRGPQLAFGAQPAQIVGNVFMRGRNFPGLGLDNLGNAPGLRIEGNFFGSPGEQELALSYIDNQTDQMLTKLAGLVAQGKVALDADQGNYITAWRSTSNLRGATFARNFVSGNTLPSLWNPQTNRYDIARDHAVYIKQYKDVDMYQNYFSGWSRDASGHLKFRNAEGLQFAANYLNTINFMARPYDNSATLSMRDTYIFNNYFNHASMDYWQNFSDAPSKFIDTTNYLVFNNLFAANTTTGCLITGTWRHTITALEEGGNRYMAPFDGVQVRACDVLAKAPQELLTRLPASKQALASLQAPLPRYRHPGGLLRVGKGLRNAGGAQCLFDGKAPSNYGSGCVNYSLTAGLGFVPEETFIEFAYSTPARLTKITPRGYWRQGPAGSLGDWRLEGCADLQCNYRSEIVPARPLSFDTALIPATAGSYRAFRLVYVGGVARPNGGGGAAGFSELEATYTPVGQSL